MRFIRDEDRQLLKDARGILHACRNEENARSLMAGSLIACKYIELVLEHIAELEQYKPHSEPMIGNSK